MPNSIDSPANPRPRAMIVLAAGASCRFGSTDKLLTPLQGRPLAEAAFRLAAETEAVQRFAVVSSPEVERLAQASGLETLTIPAGGAQSDSLKAGLRHLTPETQEVMILLADMPWVTREDIDALIAKGAPACARLGPARLPPVLLPVEWVPEILRVEADQGARAWLSRIPTGQCLSLPEAHLRDVDLPDDLADPFGDTKDGTDVL
ncbi:nucleotidyltransferase family protein [Celeribacter naphthalenivorans]|uniref:nucleotidyltransferase family protein n=1 Tax=Celeribacter naphthalenivorans TaxID=1614694 RepID=UPI001CF9AEC5|nr:nucleotidyltransferase family protein [Celeribacter naphthalenivorans]